MNKPITSIQLVEGGNQIRQGDHFTLEYTLLDATGQVADLSGKDISVTISSAREVLYETTATFQNSKVRIFVDENFGYGQVWLEITVTDPNDATYRRKFPANRNDGRLEISKGDDDLPTGGVPRVSLQQFRVEWQEAMSGLTEDSEVINARNGEALLGARLDKDKQELSAQLADKAQRDEVDSKIARISNGSPKPFQNLAAIKAAYPIGADFNTLNIENGQFYWWNGSAWVSGGVWQATQSGDFPATNGVSNGDFSNGITGWSATRSTRTAANNILTVLADGTDGLPGVHRLTSIQSATGKKVYIKFRAKVYDFTATSLRVNPFVSTSQNIDVPIKSYDEWNEYSLVVTLTGTETLRLYLYTRFLSVLPTNGSKTEFQFVDAIDLSTVFGIGKEPTLAEMDEYMTRFPNKHFNGTVSPFLTQKELMVYFKGFQSDVSSATAKVATLEADVIDLKQDRSYKEPFPARITPELIPLGSSRRFKCVDHNNVLWATSGANVEKSTDGVNWQTVLTIDIAQYGELYATGLMVTGTNRILIGTMTGRVLVSNTAQTSYSLAFTFGDVGLFSLSLAHKQYDNLVMIGGYNSNAASGTTGSKEVWLSKDYGATFQKIFTGSVINANRNYHVHDIEYDPWEQRLHLAVGDMENRNYFYSDNLGATWVKVFNEFDHPNNLQPTQIIAYSHGLVMGSDDATHGGLHYLSRKTGQNLPVYANDFVPNFYPIANGPSLAPAIFAVKSAVVRSPERNVTLMPFRWMQAGNRSRLLASADGLRWFEIWRASEEITGLLNMHPLWQNGELYAVGAYDNASGRHIFKFKVPVFISAN